MNAPVISYDWSAMSRELELRLDATGTVVWADARATRILRIAIGARLRQCAVVGTEAKVDAFVDRAANEDVREWELSLVATGAPATVCVSTKLLGQGVVAVHGWVMPEGQVAAVRQINDVLGEMMTLNREIGRQKKELAAKHQELTGAYSELSESNKGVLSLHAELAEKADALRRAADIKARVVANVSHEFRTPLHTILGLSKLLLGGADGPLNDEQRKQLGFIRGSAEELSELVNDMLDLAKAESGRGALRPSQFSATDLFAALRGMLRPLNSVAEKVSLRFEPPAPELELNTDQSKIAQILRNLISNALKFTERGEVVVSAQGAGPLVVFKVKDTGIGIAEEHFGRIFEEFGQVENRLQTKAKGTGLGLALSRKLAELLGGTLTVESRLEHGSTFTLSVPAHHPEVHELERLSAQPLDPARSPVLVVEDDRKTIFIYDKYLAMAGFQVVPARSVEEARTLLKTIRPAAIVLDIMLEGESSWDLLLQLKKDPNTKDTPVLVVTVTNKEKKARALGADEFWLKPVDKEVLLRKLRSVTKPGHEATVLVIDDDERARYLVRRLLADSPYRLLEAQSGPEGVQVAQQHPPDVILLDFLLQDMTAFDVLDDLKSDPRTRSVPVIIVTSHVLDPESRARLAAHTEVILAKESLSRELAINRIRDALVKASGGGWRAAGNTTGSSTT